MSAQLRRSEHTSVRILGIGIDLSATQGFRSTFEARQRFLHQFCTERELRSIENSASPLDHANCIFAAKEAIGKAFGTGLVEELWFDAIEISLRTSKRPLVSISIEALKWARRRFSVAEIHIEVSCCRSADFVSAVCILSEGRKA